MTPAVSALFGSTARGYWIGGALCALTLLPVLGLQDKDSFPISTYPMFAARRGQPKLYKLVAVFADGSARPVPPELIGSSELLQAKAMINRAVKQGARAERALCERVAEHAAGAASLAGATELQLQEVRYDPLSYFEKPAAAADVRVLERCDVVAPRAGTE